MELVDGGVTMESSPEGSQPISEQKARAYIRDAVRGVTYSMRARGDFVM